VKKLESFFVVMMFALLAIVATAQVDGTSEPGFNLSILILHRGGVSQNTHTLEVKLTNTSNEMRRETFCGNNPGGYSLMVVHDGALMEEREEVQTLRKQGRFLGCYGVKVLRRSQPGQYVTDELEVNDFYDMSKPGTYEITVSKETNPDHPEKSVTVKSNTLTVVVPEPESSTPN